MEIFYKRFLNRISNIYFNPKFVTPYEITPSFLSSYSYMKSGRKQKRIFSYFRTFNNREPPL